MRTITRYVLGQLAVVFFVSLGVVTLLFIVWGVMREALAQGLGIEQTLRLIPYVLPEALRFSIPATALFATSSVFGRMAGANEVVALKSIGISPWAILAPAFAAAAFLSLASVCVNDLAVSWGRAGIRKVIIESVEEVVYSTLRTQQNYSANRFSISVRAVEDRRLISPIVTFQPDPREPDIVIRAEWAELAASPADDTLTIRLHNGRAIGPDMQAQFPGTIERVLPLSQASRRSTGSASPSQLALANISEAIAEQHADITERERELAALAAMQMVAGDFPSLFDKSWRREHQDLLAMRKHLYRLQAEPHRRWANGFSCLCFVFIGAPLAMRLKKAEFWTSFFACFLPILLVYYPLLQYSVGEAKIGALPAPSVWLANVILILWGAWLLRRVMRY